MTAQPKPMKSAKRNWALKKEAVTFSGTVLVQRIGGAYSKTVCP
jgi:hypothetical protein